MTIWQKVFCAKTFLSPLIDTNVKINLWNTFRTTVNCLAYYKKNLNHISKQSDQNQYPTKSSLTKWWSDKKCSNPPLHFASDYRSQRWPGTTVIIISPHTYNLKLDRKKSEKCVGCWFRIFFPYKRSKWLSAVANFDILSMFKV